MKLTSSLQPLRTHPRRVLHFMTAAAFVVLCTALPAFAQTATYSDSWFVDNSPETYDPSIDSYSVTASPDEIAGVGVTEADYYTDSESVQTTLTAPDGTSASVTQYSDPWYSRAEVTLPYTFDENAPPGNEVQYTVDTAHQYYRDPSSGDPCPTTDPRMEMPAQPCYIARASYNAAAPQFGFFSIFTRFIMTISLRITSYQLSSISPSRCVYRVDCPEGYTCGFRSIWYYPRPGGSPCTAYAVIGSLYINRRYCINSVYGRLSPVPVPCT